MQIWEPEGKKKKEKQLQSIAKNKNNASNNTKKERRQIFFQIRKRKFGLWLYECHVIITLMFSSTRDDALMQLMSVAMHEVISAKCYKLRPTIFK